MAKSKERAGDPPILDGSDERVPIERDAPWHRPRIDAMPEARRDRYSWPDEYVRRRLRAADDAYIGALIAGIADDATWVQSRWVHDALRTPRALEIATALARLPPTEQRASTLRHACGWVAAGPPTADGAAHVIEAMHPEYERHFVHALIDCTVALAAERPLGDRLRLRLAAWIERGLASEHLVPEHDVDSTRSTLVKAHRLAHGIAAAEAYVASLGEGYGYLLEPEPRHGAEWDEPPDGHLPVDSIVVELAHLEVVKELFSWSKEDARRPELWWDWPDVTRAKLVAAYVALLTGRDGWSGDPYPSATSTVLHHLHRTDEAQAWATTHRILEIPDHPLRAEAQRHLRYNNGDRILDVLRAAGLEVRALPELERGSGWAHLAEILMECDIACPLLVMHKSEFGDERPKHPVLLNELRGIAPQLDGFEFDERPAGEHAAEGQPDTSAFDDEWDGPVCLLANDFERGYRSGPLDPSGAYPALVFINSLLAELGAPQRIFTWQSPCGPQAGFAVCLTPAQRDALVEADLFR